MEIEVNKHIQNLIVFVLTFIDYWRHFWMILGASHRSSGNRTTCRNDCFYNVFRRYEPSEKFENCNKNLRENHTIPKSQQVAFLDMFWSEKGIKMSSKLEKKQEQKLVRKKGEKKWKRAPKSKRISSSTECGKPMVLTVVNEYGSCC